ncbi:MAG: PrkA family serine protein kinase [Planctomycetota bacterium]
MTDTNRLQQIFNQQPDAKRYRDLHEECSFEEYLAKAQDNPRLIRNAYQRIYEMIISHGTEPFTEAKQKLTRYRFFDDLVSGGREAIFGLERSLERLVAFFKSAAWGYGTERRILLLHGPVGSAKSTIARLLKRGLEEYTRTPDGALYTYEWMQHDDVTNEDRVRSPMNEDPLKLLPLNVRREALAEINKHFDGGYTLDVTGDLNPYCRRVHADLMKKYQGDWRQVIRNHVRVVRMTFSEKARVGIGTFQPKDEKNQDSTELTGDINYRKIAVYGSDTDPRAFNFDGEFNVANRGLIEFIEILKLDVAFLYDLLGASQEHSIKPKKFAQTDIDEVIIGHTNEPEYRKLQSNELMEAFRDRTVKIDVPYNTRLSHEVRIYKKDFSQERVRDRHIAPHTIDVAAMWAVLTRLEDPPNQNLSAVQKMKLYDGKSLPGFTEDNVRELRDIAPREGMKGISPRYIQDKISNVLAHGTHTVINPFMVMNELEEGLRHHSLISSEEERKRYRELLGVVRQEYEDIVKNEVQRAISADTDAISRLCSNYIDNLKAYTQREKVKNRYTGQYEEPDERLMQGIESKMNIAESQKDEFRHEIMSMIGSLALEGKQFDWRTNDRLRKALEDKLFEDQKDQIKLRMVVSNVADRETQEKIDVVKGRLIRDFGYNDESATDVLNFVAGIFARGDKK